MNEQKKKRPNKKGRPNPNKGRSARDKRRLTPADLETEPAPEVRYNDPSWMVLDAEMAQSCTAFTFNQFVGVPTELIGPPGFSQREIFTHPSIMKVFLNPSAGYGADVLDPINQCALKMYTALSANNAKTTQYGPEDVIMCELALGEIVSLASYIVRAFGTSNISNPRNRSWPVKVIEAMGINYDDFAANYEVYRGRFNLLVTRAGAIVFPMSIDYFKACAALYDTVFLDSISDMAQTIITVPYSGWILDEASNESGSVLETVDYPFRNKSKVKMAEVLDIFEDMINAMLTSSTLNYLYTDILKLAGDAARFALPAIASGYVSIPMYSEEFRVQLENAVIVGAPIPDGHPNIQNATSKNNVIADAGSTIVRYRPTFSTTTLPLYTSILNFHNQNVTVEERISALRFRPQLREAVLVDDAGTDNLCEYYVTYQLPDHYVVQVDIVGGSDDPNVNAKYSSNVLNFKTGELYEASNALQVSAMSSFKGAPIMYVAYNSNDGGQMHEVFCGTLGQLDYYTNVEQSAIKLFREMATYALYAPKGSFASGK